MTDNPAAAQESPPAASPAAPSSGVPRGLGLWLLAAGLCASVLAVGVLWQRVERMQEQLARQAADANAAALEAKTLAKAAQENVREAVGRAGLLEAKVAEVALQRTQLEELMQSLSRSRDENLLVDIEAALRLSQQQAVLTGSVEPMVSALRAAEQRVARAAQPRLSRVQRALAQDLERLTGSTQADVPALVLRFDELIRAVDELPMANAVVRGASPVAPKSAGRASASAAAPAASSASGWGASFWQHIKTEAVGLVRVSRIDAPEASLLAPEQAWMLRENLKLKLLNARLGLLSRQFEVARSDLQLTAVALQKYADTSAKPTQQMLTQMQALQAQIKNTTAPRLDESLAALSAAAAGR